MATRPTMDFEAVEVEVLIRLVREAAIGNDGPENTQRRLGYQALCDRLVNHKQDLHDYRYSTNRRK